MAAVDESVPDPVRDRDKPFLMPDRGRLHDHRSWHRCDGPRRARYPRHQLRGRDRRHPPGPEDHGHRYRDVPQAARRGHGPARTVVCCSAAPSATTSSVARLSSSRVPSPRTPTSRPTSTSSPRMRAAVTTRSTTNYRPQFYFRTTDVTGVITLPEGTEMVMPGDNTEMTVALIQPIAMEEGLGFAIREGGRTVGAGARRRPGCRAGGESRAQGEWLDALPHRHGGSRRPGDLDQAWIEGALLGRHQLLGQKAAAHPAGIWAARRALFLAVARAGRAGAKIRREKFAESGG
jgi:hypothetical protein